MSTSRILVVDDENAIRTFLVRALEHEGYVVRAARSGEEAMSILATESFDLLLTDIRMDHMDGVTLLQQARQLYSDMAVIMLTGHATVGSAVTALREGAYNYLLKPVKNEDILTAVAAGLADRTREQRRDMLEHIAGQMMQVLRSDDTPVPSEVISYLGLSLNTATYTVLLDAIPLDLTPTEFRLLLKLARTPNVAYDYITLVQTACGYTCTRQEAQEIIGTHVRNLRQKLGIEPEYPLYIEAVRGIGYRLLGHSLSG